MKKLILLISICISISLTAQNPQGKLFVHTQKSSINEKDVFGFVQYPSLQYYTIDSTELTDMMIYNDKIYIANNDVGMVCTTLTGALSCRATITGDGFSIE